MKSLIIILLVIFSLETNAQNNLRQYIVVAKQNSPLINNNTNLSKANLLEAERLKAQYTKPQMGFTANYLFAPIISTDNNKSSFEANAKDATNYYGYDLANSNGGNYQATLNVTQPLFNGKRYKTASEQLLVTAQINENNNKLTEHDIEKIVSDQYILCLQDSKQVGYAEAMVKLCNEQNEMLVKLVESGIYKQSDLILLTIEQQNFLAQLTSFKANYRRDLMDLNILCGVEDTILVDLQNSDLVLNEEVSNSMFLEKYHLDSLDLVAQQNAFELKYKPQINLFANTGLNAAYAATIPNRFGISAGMSFTYNFFDGNQKSINKNKTRVLEQSVSFSKHNFISQNTVRKAKILNELHSYSDRISIAEQQLKYYNQLLKSYKNEIISGQISIINYTTVLKNMAILQRDYALLFSQQQSLINAYNYWNW